MNRREFLVALAAAGCGAKAVPDRVPRHVFRDAGGTSDAAATTSIADDLQPHAQIHASPIVGVDSLLARVTETDLVFVDATTLKPVRSVVGGHGSLCGFGPGAVLALTRGNGPCEVERFAGSNAPTSMLVPGGCTSLDGALMVAAGSSLYLSASGDTLAVYKVAHDQLTEDGTIQLDDRTRDTLQMVGLPDGRLLVPAGNELRVYRGAAAQERIRAPARIAHLAAAGADRIWYSARSESGDGSIERVVLAKLEPGLPAVATLATRVIHLAAAADGTGAAVLTVDATEWAIVVLDANGQQRQRIHLPADFAQLGLASCFVALASKTVVLDARAHGLFGWNIATGARIAS